MPRRHSSPPDAFILVLALLLAAPAAVGAESSDPKAEDDAEAEVVAKIQQINRTAMLHFDDLNFALAEKALLEALAVIKDAGLTSGPAVLSTHGNLAVLYSAGLKQPDKAVAHFKAALALKPDLKLSKLRATPETEANLARAKAEMGGAQPAEDGALSCPTSGEIQAGDEVTVTCTTIESLPAAAVRLNYKANDSEEYQVVQMTKEGTSGGVTTWVAKIPGSQTQAKSIPFFVAAIDASGATLTSSGREDSPNIIEVRAAGVVAGPPPVTEAEGEEEEDDEYEEEIDDENPLAALERERWKEHHGSKGTWLISMGAGSGLGYAYGKATEAFGKYGVGFNPGIAPASLGHLVWEVAYFVGRKTALSVGGRHQGIFGGPAGTATGAHSVLARSLFFTEEGEGKVRWYFALAAGGGEGFRMTVNASINDVDTGAPTGYTVKDTVRGGPFVAGAGGGMLYRIGRRWHLSLDTQVLGGFPHFSAVLDLTGGVRWQY